MSGRTVSCSDELPALHHRKQMLIIQLPVAEHLRGQAFLMAGQSQQQVDRGDLVQPLLERLVGGAADQGGGGLRRPDPALLLPGDGLLAEELLVQALLEGIQINAAGGQEPAGFVLPVADQAQHDVVRADAVAAGAHGFVAGVAEDGLQVWGKLDLHGVK